MHDVVEFTAMGTLARGFQVYARNFVAFTAISALVFVPAVVWLVLMLQGVIAYSEPAVIAMSILTGILAAVVGLVLFQATWDTLRGREVSIRRSFDAIGPRVLPALGVAIVVGLLVELAMMAFVIPGLIAMVSMWVAIPVCVVENRGVMDSMYRSANLISGHGWPVFGVIFVMRLFDRLPDFLLKKGFEKGLVSAEVSIFVPMVIAIFAAAASAAITTVGYHDLRVTKEGINREELLAIFD